MPLPFAFAALTGATDLEPSHRYRVVYRAPGQRRDRTAILDYLGRSAMNNGALILVWSGRPLAGTMTFPASWVSSVNEVEKARTPIYLPRNA